MPTLNAKTKTIGLLWHNPNSGNLGVSALTYAQIHLIVSAAKKNGYAADFIIFGYPGRPGLENEKKLSDSLDTSISCIHFGIRSIINEPLRTVRAFRGCDAVIDIGEGDSFSDIYGNKRLLNQFAGKLLAHATTNRLLLAPQTLGPFSGHPGKTIAKLTAKIAKQVFARDDSSSAHFKKTTGLTPRLSTDVAFSLPFEKLVSKQNPIGINISGLLFNGGYNSRNQFGLSLDYKQFCIDTIDFFLSQNLEVHLVSHVSGKIPQEDDYKAALAVQKLRPSVTVAPRFTCPSEAKTHISQYSFFIGARMHATIAAVSSGVPVVPIAYSRKFHGLFGSLGYNHVIDATSTTNNNALTSLKDKFAKKETLKHDATVATQCANNVLVEYTSYLESIFK